MKEKRHILPALALAGALVALVGIDGRAENAPGQDTLEERVQKLEKDLAVARDELGAMAADLERTTGLLDQTVRYLREQSKGAAAMAATLDASERAGFAKGINFGSRELLLAGWRAQLAAQQRGLPGKPPPDPQPEGAREH